MTAWLTREANERIREAASLIETGLGKSFSASILVGAAMNPARWDRAHAPELIGFSRTGDLDLQSLATTLAPAMRRGVRIRILTEKELSRSSDVFALEIAEWIARHQLLGGSDPFQSVRIEPADLRRGLETELRGISRKTRNRVLLGIASKMTRDNAEDAILVGYDTFVVAAYHAIKLFGGDPPAVEPEIVRQVGALTGAPVDAFLDHLASLRRRPGGGSMDALSALLGMIEPLLEKVDQFEVVGS